jgi:hypothetical protein
MTATHSHLIFDLASGEVGHSDAASCWNMQCKYYKMILVLTTPYSIPRFDMTKQGGLEGVAGITNQKSFHEE